MNQLLLAFYGDDFTGSNDAMESLARLGIRTILFVEPPGPEQLRRFEGIQAVGVAGVSRSLPTAEMDAELLPVFKRFRELNAPVFHYKVCSTFDSSPEIGSIGHAIDLGQETFASPFVPLLVGVPELWRYCVFGNLFARSGPESDVYRLDRHPTMRYHPTTPMTESDLRLHLSRQTAKKIGLFDILQVAAPKGEVEERFAELLGSSPEIVLFDVLYEEQLSIIGRLIWEHANQGDAPLFVVGSSGMGTPSPPTGRPLACCRILSSRPPLGRSSSWSRSLGAARQWQRVRSPGPSRKGLPRSHSSLPGWWTRMRQKRKSGSPWRRL